MEEPLYTKEQIDRAQKRVERLGKLLRIKLRQNLPYYGFIITKLTDFIFTDEIPTACTDGRDIWVNPAFMVDKTDSAINFILLHELLHVVFLHRVRFEENKLGYHHKLWNYACDYVVNYELVTQKASFERAGIEIEFPEVGLLMKNEDGSIEDLSAYTAEKMYARLEKDVKFIETCADTDGAMNDDVTSKLPIGAPASGESVKSIERAVKSVLREVQQKGYNLGGTGLEREIANALQTTKIRWDRYLRKFLSSKITDEDSYDTPNKKYLPHRVIMPGPGGTEELIDDVFIFVDTSGSIDNEALQKALDNAYTISHDYRATISLAFWDTEVSHTILDIQPDEIKKAIANMKLSTGGTDFRCVLDYIKGHKLNSAAFVVFTDGFFEIPSISPKIKRKMLIALEDTKSYNKELERLGKIVSFNEKE